MTPANLLGSFFKASVTATGAIVVEVAIATTTYFLTTGGDVVVSMVELILGVLAMSVTVAIWSILPAFIVTFTVILTLGPPTLWLLGRKLPATRPIFAAVGAGYGAGLGMLAGSLIGAGAASAGLLLLPGAVAGWTIWTTTRGATPTPPRPPPARPS